MTRNDPTKLLLAASLGFAAGLLFAPRSCEETREQLRAKADEARGRMRNATGELKRQASESKEQLKSAAADVRQRGKAVTSTLKEQASGAKEDVKDAAEETKRTTRNGRSSSSSSTS